MSRPKGGIAQAQRRKPVAMPQRNAVTTGVVCAERSGGNLNKKLGAGPAWAI